MKKQIFTLLLMCLGLITAYAQGPGSLDLSFDPGVGFSTASSTVAKVQNDGKIIIGGFFTSYQGVARNNIVRINTDGSIDNTFSVGTGFNGSVLSISLQTDGKIIVGGSFTSYNGNTANRIARLNSDGSFDASFNLGGTGANGAVGATYIQADGKIYITSRGYTSYNGVTRTIARLNADGTLDATYGAGNSTSGIWYLVQESTGKIVVASEQGFSSKLVRFDLNGAVDLTYNSPSIGVGPGRNPPKDLVILPDDRTIFSAGTSPNATVKRFLTDGSVDVTFTAFNFIVSSMKLQNDGKLVVSGSVTGGLQRLNTDGSVDVTFNTEGTSFNAAPNQITMQADGKIIAMGSFTSYNGITRNGIARINGTASTPALALSFDGVDDHITIPGINVANQSFTFECWAKSNASNRDNILAGQGPATSNTGLHIGFRPNNVFTFAFYNNDLNTTTQYTDNLWHHWACVYSTSASGNIRSIYRDGVLVAQDNPTNNFTGTGTFYIGRHAWGANFSGNIDVVKIWNRALCQGEIVNNMNCMLNPAMQTNLQALYNFNQGFADANNSTVTSLTDESGNNRNGTLTGFALTGTSSNWVTPGGIAQGVFCSTFAPPAATITPAGSTTFCAGGSVVLNANTGTGLSYQWRFNGNNISGATNASYTANAAGSYTVVVTKDGCSTTSSATTITTLSSPTATITPPASTILCAGSAIVLNANTGGGLTYQWRLNGNTIGGATNTNYIANATGSYSVAVTQNGCTTISSPVIISPDQTLPTAVCKNVSVVLNASGTGTIVIPATTNTLLFEDWTGDNSGYYAVNNPSWPSSTLNWNLLSGDIDRSDFISGIPGFEIDLSGFQNGVIESKQTFNFTPGSYTFSFQQIANSLDGNGVQVDIGSLLNQTFISSLSITSESVTFTVTSNVSAKIKLTQVGPSDARGSFMGQIRLVKNIASTLAIENGSSDNCTIASITASKTNFTCSDIGSNTVTLTVTDGSGNVGTCQAIVTVVDNILPVISSCPTNITLNATSAAGALVNYTTPTATDVCQVTVNRTSGLSSGSVFPIGTTTVTHTATDAGGNVATCSFTVTVSGMAPVIVNPGTINANTASGQCKANVMYAATETTGVPASTITYSIPPGSSFNVGTTAVTATATNAVGSSSTTFNVVVTDNQLPTARTKNNLFINLGPTGTVTLTAADIDSGSTDACGIQSRTISPSTFTCANVGPVNITLTVTDVNGNVASKVATASVIDNIAPTVLIKPVTTYLNASGTATITAAQVDNGTTDNCGIASISLDKTSFSCSNASTSNSGVLTVKTTVDNQYSAYISTDDNVQGTFVGSGNNWPTLTTYTANLAAGQTYYLHVFAEDLGGPEMMIGDFAVTGDFKFMNGAQTMSTNAAYWKVSTTGWSNYVPALDVGPNGTSPWGNYPGVSSSARFIWRTPWNTTGNDVAYFSTPILYTGNNTVLFTATDVNGNSASAIANITVLDTISPIINCPANINTIATSASGAVVSYTTPTATDNCSSATVSRIAGPASGSIFPLGITTVTYKATDPSGNSTTCSFTVNVSGVAPAIVSPGTISANTTAGQCKAAVTYSATETTGIPASTITYSIPSGSLFNVGTTSVTATATNVIGSSSTTFNVVVTDNQAPTAIAQNVTVQLDANGVGSTSVAAVNNGSTDACGIASVTLSKTSFTCSNLGANTVTLTVTDVNGNVATANATVTVSDAILPTITAPADINLTRPSCQTTNTTVTLGNAVAADNCGVTVTNNAPATFPVGTTSVVWIARDAAGNTATATQTVTITKLPSLVVSSIKDINCSGPNSGSVTATATGGRAPYLYQLNNGAFQNNGSFSNLAPGVYSVTVKDADNCTAVQNQITLTEPFCLQAVNDAFDNCAGKPITIQKSTLLGNDANPWNVSIYMDVAQPANGTVVDNGTSITYTPNANFSGIDQFNYTIKKNDGTIAFAGNGHVYEWVPFYGVTWNSARAAASLRYYNGMQGYLVTVTSQAEMNFVLSKLQGAGWMGASDRANEGVWRWVTGPEGLEENGQGRHFSNQFKYPSNYGNCAAATAPALMGQYANWAGGEPNDCGAYLNQYSATDINRGGEHYAHFYGQGIWNDYPDNVGGNIQGYIVEYGGLEGSVASTGTSTATITIDNKQVILSETVVPATCATAQDGSITVSASGGTAPYSYNWGGGITTSTRTGLGTGNYTVTVTDAKGCIATKTITVNVGDNIPPVAIAKNITVDLNTSGTVSITAAQVNDGSYDNCSIQSMSVTPSTFNCSTIGGNTVTLTVTDNFNNTSTTTATVTIQDITAPTITCASDVNANTSSTSCTANVTVPSPTVGDNCLIVTLTNNITNTSDASGIYPIGTTTITWTATDASGNISTCRQKVIVTDNVAPVVVTKSVTIDLDANGQASITTAAVNNGSSDNCGIASYSLDKTSFNCTNVGLNVVTLTVTDVHGNSAAQTAAITVQDKLAPTVVTQNITVQLNAAGEVSITPSMINNGSYDNCTIASYSLDKTAFNCANVGANTVTLTVTDVNGNSASNTATVTVQDVTIPVVITQNLMVTLSNGSASITAAQINNGSNDACGIQTLSVVPSTFDCSNIGANTVTLTVTDVNGNSNSQTAVVTVNGVVPSCALSSSPNTTGTVIGSTNTLAAVNQMFLGYGPQSMKLLCTPTGGGPFTYSWSGPGLSNTSIANPVFTPTAAGNYTLSCTITNGYGCTSKCSITICVIDVRDPNASVNNPKVIICHLPAGNPNNRQTLSVGLSAVPAHIGLHGGDKLGSCNAICGSAKTSGTEGELITQETTLGEVNMIVYPNPSQAVFNFKFEGAVAETAELKLYDVNGRLVLDLTNLPSTETISIGQDLAPGVYMVQVKCGEFSKGVKLTKLN